MNLLSYLLGALAALLVGLSKTGLPGVSLPAILLLIATLGDARQANGAMLPVLLVADVFAVVWFRRHAQWDRLVWLFPAVVAGMVPGWVILTRLTAEQLTPVIGWVVLIMVVLELCRQRLGWENVPRQWWFAGMMGFVAGFSTIIAHAAMPVMTIYLLSQGMDKEKFIGTAAWFFFIVNLSKIPFYVAAGLITAETLHFDLFVAPVAIVGGLLGVTLLAHIPQKLFNTLALALAGAAAAMLIVSW
jgi:uncharacterized membrane protein YfcA